MEGNLLLREEHENGKIFSFKYLPHTNLLTAKFTQKKEHILIREFFSYDDSHNLIQIMMDDGKSENINDLNGVTQRTWTNYTLRQGPPFLHLPEWVEKKYLEKGQEKLFNRAHLHYDRWGNICQEDLYDSEGKFAYSIYRTYNERGDLLSETNAHGDTAEYEYDKKGFNTKASSFSGRLSKLKTPDLRGRIIKEELLGTDGISKQLSYSYDFHDDLFEKIDEYGNTTHYSHDPICHKITRTDYPEIALPDGSRVPVTTYSTFDPLGREISKTDANGYVTFFKYNAYGSPTQIIYPNGNKEFFIYYNNGNLKSHTNSEGLITEYEYDVLGRVILKKFSSNRKIAEETFSYNNFHLFTETDKEGNLTTYTYDGLGRKIEEDFCGHIQQYHYDTLGRINKIYKLNGDNTLSLHYEHDYLDRIIGETKTNLQGEILYQIRFDYDKDGNKIEITRYINDEPSLETYSYDSLGRLTESQDPLGHKTTTIYDDEKKVHITENLNQITTIKSYDPLDRLINKKTLSPQGKTIASKEWFFDPVGNLIMEKDHIYQGTQYQMTQSVGYSYNSRNWLKNCTRALGTSKERTTHYTYWPSGKVATKTRQNGVTLNYKYSPFGHLTHLTSSDGTIDHQFEPNFLGYLQSAQDHGKKINIQRQTDPFGNVMYESFLHGISIEKRYDSFNRPYLVRIADQGEVEYEYDPLYLRTITRGSYIHQYKTYNLNGNLISEELSGGCGSIEYQFDSKGRKKTLRSPYFSQVFDYDPSDNLIFIREADHLHQYTYDGLSQLTSEDGTTYRFDSNYNRIEKDGQQIDVNELNEILTPLILQSSIADQPFSRRLSCVSLARLTYPRLETVGLVGRVK